MYSMLESNVGRLYEQLPAGSESVVMIGTFVVAAAIVTAGIVSLMRRN